ncbi:MAG: Hsp70 family protein [Mycobacteriaceae bacterium]|nr:Hsp70 family protein [Mycobacteriaceae bacterium]
MSDSVGLSIGMTHLVAARVGDTPIRRRAVLTLFPNRAPAVGLPSENPDLTEPGLVLTGFVERVGDPVPLLAPDGSTHRADQLLVEALDAMVAAVGGPPPSDVTIAVPAHWSPAVLGALRASLRTKANLSPHGVAPPLISDASAALAALQVSPGLPNNGIVALLDFGGSGTNITLADAASNFEPIDETVRYTEFSGDQIDQALLTHVLADISGAGGMDPTGTVAVGALTRLRDQARLAKERLSAETAAELPADLPGYRSNIRVTRNELESLIRGPFAGVIFALEELLQRNRIAGAGLSAVATVGGGASIPLITQRLSEHFRVPVITTGQPALNTAAGAALIASRGPADAPTGLATAADAPTSMADAVWAAGAAGLAATESAADGAASATFRALAWSEEQGANEPVPYSGNDYDYDPGATGARPQLDFSPTEEPPPVEEPLPWYRRPQLIFAAAAVLLLAAVGGLAYTLTSKSSSSGGTPTATSPAVTNPESPGVPLTQTVTVTGANGSPTVVTPPAPPPAPGPNPTSPPPTSPSTAPTTTTEPTTATTTTTYVTTTTQPTTTTAPPVTTTTAAPPTTSAAPPTSSAAPPPTSQRQIITLFPHR